MTVFASPYSKVDIPQSNILTYLFGPQQQAISNDPIWINSKDDSQSLSAAQVLQWVRRLGHGLGKLGLRRGDVVLICTPNHIFVPVAYLGVVGAGYVFSGANPNYTESELLHQISDTTAKVILAHPSLLSRILPAADKAGVPRDRIFTFSDRTNPPIQGLLDWRDAVATSAGDAWAWPELTPSEAASTVATINYSSGTTGLPKGVCVSHVNLVANVEQLTSMRFAHAPYTFEDRPAERWIGFLPLYHAYGQITAILQAIRFGTPVYVMSEFVFEDFLQVIQKYRITTLQVAPPILVMLVKRPETAQYDLSSIREILSGGAPLKRELQNECQRRLKVDVSQAWGMTELTCGALAVPHGWKDESASVGRLLPNCEGRLVDEQGRDVGVGEQGELLVRGPNVCMRYWRNEKATKETLDDEGWLHSGDIAVCDDQGMFWIVDRKKELIKVNALQVAPAELESLLLENESVADAAVVGIHIDGNEWPRAYVVIQEDAKGKVTPADIQEWMAKRVAKHKKLVGGVAFIDQVPKLASGKIQRKTMREWSKRDAELLEKEGGKAKL